MDRMNLRALRRMVWLLGYDWSDDEIERLLAPVLKSFEMLDRLDALPLRGVEPPLLYRMREPGR